MTTKMNNGFCNNCGKEGHTYSQCKMPITSLGVIVYRNKELGEKNQIEYLMICRKNTLGFIDFMRGKYSVYNKDYVMNMIKQMTMTERADILAKTFDQLWCELWAIDPTNAKKHQYNHEEYMSCDRFNQLTKGINDSYGVFSHSLKTMVAECDEKHGCWLEPEWGFPKGRRNYREKDYDCALREFSEETGYPIHTLHNVQNIFPFEEIFMGSNYKSYKHRYYLTHIDYNDSVKYDGHFQSTEVSKMEWKTLDECLVSMRNYNLEKKRLLENIDCVLNKYVVCGFK